MIKHTPHLLICAAQGTNQTETVDSAKKYNYVLKSPLSSES